MRKILKLILKMNKYSTDKVKLNEVTAINYFRN